ncbi:MAG: glycosyltransferase family 4 protein [Clostridia bacterium]|nr:glycosyltransferase family 4 protein [Clostridia bacterium]
MKILYVTTVPGTVKFFKRFIKDLIDEGHTVDIACNNTKVDVIPYFYELGCKVYTISTSRSPLNFGNLKAIKQIKKLVRENGYDIVHCHTPVAAMCTRLACKGLRKKQGVRVIYTAHGFHFYEGAPKKNWILFYPIEKLCARYTDVLITINQEDFALAKKKMKAKQVVYVPGVGIDLERFSSIFINKAEKRREIGVPEETALLFSVGELNENKNQATVIKAIKDLDIHYAIAGEGPSKNALAVLSEELGISDRVHFLGYRTDVLEIYLASDFYAFPSYREGLSVALMEAMASGLPVACSRIRGNTDLIDENGGMLFNPHSVEECKVAISSLLSCDINEMGKYNKEKVKGFSYDVVKSMLVDMYNQ